MKEPPARWWELRRAQNRKPVTYRCPLCGAQLPSLMEHVLMVPEGDVGRRRHAHTECVLAARREGRLPTRSEWQRSQSSQRSQPSPRGPLTRLLRALGRRSAGAG
jgi:hypothetical protein